MAKKITKLLPPRERLPGVLKLLGRPQGATVEEMAAVTGWQAHSARARMTHLRKAGTTVSMTREARGAVYRIGDAK